MTISLKLTAYNFFFPLKGNIPFEGRTEYILVSVGNDSGWQKFIVIRDIPVSFPVSFSGPMGLLLALALQLGTRKVLQSQ